MEDTMDTTDTTDTINDLWSKFWAADRVMHGFASRSDDEGIAAFDEARTRFFAVREALVDAGAWR